MSNLIRSEYPRVRRTINKGNTYYVVDLRGRGFVGTKRPQFRTKAAALKKAAEVAEQVKADGLNGLNCFSTVATDKSLRAWEDRLAKFGKHIGDAVEHYVAWLEQEERNKAIPLLKELFPRWYEDRKGDLTKRIRTRTLNDIKILSTRFARDWGNLRADEVDTQQVEDFLRSLKTKDGRDVSQQTRKNYKTKLGEFFNWAVGQKIIKTNPTDSIEVRVDYKIPSILSLAECRELLRLVQTEKHHPMLAWVVLGLFGGLRPEEAERLEWKHIDHGQVLIEPDRTKVKRVRSVPINTTLQAWLDRLDRSLPLMPRNLLRRKTRLLKSLRNRGIKSPSDVLRHSFATHWLKVHNNRAQLAELMGNTAAVIGKHYVRPVSQADAENYWLLTPDKTVKPEPSSREVEVGAAIPSP